MESKGKTNQATITITIESLDGESVNQRVVAEGGAYNHLFAEAVKKYASLVTSVGEMVFSGNLDDNLMEAVLLLIRSNRLSPEMQKKICDDFCPAERLGSIFGNEPDEPSADGTIGGLFKGMLSFIRGRNPDMTDPDKPKEGAGTDDIGEVTLPPNLDEALNDALRKDDDDAKR